MAARGAESKITITEKLLEIFPDAFKFDKEIRIPMEENGEEVQIKVTLTAAKTNIEHEGSVAKPAMPAIMQTPEANKIISAEPSEEEKQRLEQMVKGLF